jgi:hypothetical protein
MKEGNPISSVGGGDETRVDSLAASPSPEQKDDGKSKDVDRPQTCPENSPPRDVPRSSVLVKPTYKNWPGMGYNLEGEDWVVEERWDRHGKLHRDIYVPLARVFEKQKSGHTLCKGRPLVGATPRQQRAIDEEMKRGGEQPPYVSDHAPKSI